MSCHKINWPIKVMTNRDCGQSPVIFYNYVEHMRLQMGIGDIEGFGFLIVAEFQTNVVLDITSM